MCCVIVYTSYRVYTGECVGTERLIAWTSRVCYTRAHGILIMYESGKDNSESLSIYFLYSEILVIFYCDSSEFSQIHTEEAGSLRKKKQGHGQPQTRGESNHLAVLDDGPPNLFLFLGSATYHPFRYVL